MKGRKPGKRMYVGASVRQKRSARARERVTALSNAAMKSFWRLFGVSREPGNRQRARPLSVYRYKTLSRPITHSKKVRGPTLVELLLWLVMLVVAIAFLMLMAKQSMMLAIIVFLGVLAVSWWVLVLRH